MTDLLTVLEDNDQSYALVYRRKEGYSLITWSNQTSSWLRKYQTCSPQVVVLFQDQIAVNKKNPIPKQCVPILITYSKTSTPNNRFVRKASILRKLTKRCLIIDKGKLVSIEKVLDQKTEMNFPQEVIADWRVYKSRTGTTKDRPTSVLYTKVAWIRDCTMLIEKRSRLLTSTPFARTICHFLYHLRRLVAENTLMDSILDPCK